MNSEMISIQNSIQEPELIREQMRFVHKPFGLLGYNHDQMIRDRQVSTIHFGREMSMVHLKH